MRYLGTVAQNTTLPHIRDICYTEMFARTLRRLFNTNISGLILRHQERSKANSQEDIRLKRQLENIFTPEWQKEITLGSSVSGRVADSKGFLHRENL